MYSESEIQQRIRAVESELSSLRNRSSVGAQNMPAWMNQVEALERQLGNLRDLLAQAQAADRP